MNDKLIKIVTSDKQVHNKGLLITRRNCFHFTNLKVMSSLGKRRNSSWLLLVVTYDSVLDVTENVLDHAANGRGLLLSDFLSKALSLDVCSLSPEDYSGRRYDSFLSDLGCHYFFFEDRSTHLL